ncbi:MAG: hypothetical protein EA349_03195 [Halomonadaceae bacterium]|nr:MAG: hypothetical protein EA349_03195 [Halomonadaceae bacterium]
MIRFSTRLVITLVVSTVLLSGCSSTRLAYNQASWWAPWAARDYLPLDRSQRSLLRSQVNELRDWHCATEIPRYSDWLRQRQQDLDSQRPGEQQLELWLEDMQSAYRAVAQRLVIPAADLLATLDDDQVQRLKDNLAEKNRELKEQYREPSLTDQISDREERLLERLERWFGELNRDQQAMVAAWSEQRGEQNSGWLDNRQRWQDNLFASLEQRNQQGAFMDQMESLLLAPQLLQTPEYSQQSQQSRAQGITLAAELLGAADEQQIHHLQSELASLQRRIEGLDCS